VQGIAKRSFSIAGDGKCGKVGGPKWQVQYFNKIYLRKVGGQQKLLMISYFSNH